MLETMARSALRNVAPSTITGMNWPSASPAVDAATLTVTGSSSSFATASSSALERSGNRRLHAGSAAQSAKICRRAYCVPMMPRVTSSTCGN
jgi:hypothetical protein